MGEEEEAKREMDLMAVDNDEARHELHPDDKLLARFIRRKHFLIKTKSAEDSRTRNTRPQMPRTVTKLPLTHLKDKLEDLGIHTQKYHKSVMDEDKQQEDSLYRRRGRSRARDLSKAPIHQTVQSNKNESGLDFQELSRMQRRSKSRGRSVSRSRSKSARAKSHPPSKGMSSTSASATAHSLKMKAIKSIQRKGKIHESDRHIYNLKPLHLFKGKKR